MTGETGADQELLTPLERVIAAPAGRSSTSSPIPRAIPRSTGRGSVRAREARVATPCPRVELHDVDEAWRALLDRQQGRRVRGGPTDRVGRRTRRSSGSGDSGAGASGAMSSNRSTAEPLCGRRGTSHTRARGTADRGEAAHRATTWSPIWRSPWFASKSSPRRRGSRGDIARRTAPVAWSALDDTVRYCAESGTVWHGCGTATISRESPGPARRCDQGFGGGRDRRRSGDPALFRRVLCRLSYPAG